MLLNKRINVSRSLIDEIPIHNVESLGASYTHVKSLKGVVGPDTKKIVMYHSKLDSLDGLEDTIYVEQAYLGFNYFTKFSAKDRKIPKIGVLDLGGNLIESLENCPDCDSLIVSATSITNLKGAPEGIRILRCGHSTHLLSLEGCPSSVEIIECSQAPNLVIDQTHLPIGLKELITDNKNSHTFE